MQSQTHVIPFDEFVAVAKQVRNSDGLELDDMDTCFGAGHHAEDSAARREECSSLLFLSATDDPAASRQSKPQPLNALTAL